MRLAMISFSANLQVPSFILGKAHSFFIVLFMNLQVASFIQLVFLFERKEYITMYVNYVKIRVVVVIE